MFELPQKIAGIMREFKPDWFVAGGWAIDLFIGRETRRHEDIEIVIFRRDQRAVQKYFSDWKLKKAAGGALFDWREDELLQLPVHAVHCFNERGAPPFLEVLFNETDAFNWIYRRDDRIVKPLAEIYLTAETGIRFLRPEIVLLYKSKNPREKDERDFHATIGLLDAKSRKWLSNSLTVIDANHAWLKKLC